MHEKETFSCGRNGSLGGLDSGCMGVYTVGLPNEIEMVHETQYFVVKNHEEQYSIWPESKELPKGWQVVGDSATRRECLARIEELWTDMRPLSVRRHIEATAGGSEPIEIRHVSENLGSS